MQVSGEVKQGRDASESPKLTFHCVALMNAQQPAQLVHDPFYLAFTALHCGRELLNIELNPGVPLLGADAECIMHAMLQRKGR